MPEYYITLEPGRLQDRTGLAIAEIDQKRERHYSIRHLERLPAGTSYPKMAEHLTGLLGKLPLSTRQPTVLIDATGTALPVAQMIGASVKRASPYPYVYYSLITAGDTETDDGDTYRVPRRDLASTLQVMLQSDRLRIAAGLPDVEQLKSELASFQVNVTPPGQTDDLMWREKDSDDLVLAVALSCWSGERLRSVFEVFHVYL